MRELAVGGFIALVFGVAASYATGETGWFSIVNVGLGAAALVLAVVRSLGRVRGAVAPAFRGVLGRGLLRIAIALGLAVALERGAALTDIQFDWTFEGKFAASEATLAALTDLGEVDATLYYEEFDPRIRSTRLLLRTLAAGGQLRFDERRLDDYPEDEDRYAIGSSNSVVLRVAGGEGRGERSETVQRPTEGALYEALYRLREIQGGLIYVGRGAGEGDLNDTGPTGFSGLSAALQTEGYTLREFVGAARSEIPSDARALLWIAPERQLPDHTLDALESYLQAGGRLVVFLEPGRSSGLEDVLARWGLNSPDEIVVDPASGAVEGSAPGTAPLVFNYTTTHPIAHGLGASRMTLFRGARPFVPLRKPRIEDRLHGIAFASPRSWRSPDLPVVSLREIPEPPPGAVRDYHALLAAGRYPRDGFETRIAAFGDSDIASNRDLRTLYNLDLVLNAVHWTTAREPDILLRPKTVAVSGRLQFPMPLQDTLTMFQGLGLLLPELLLILGAVVWLRSRSA